MMTLKKHVNVNNSIIVQKFEQEMNGQPKEIVETQIPKKQPNMFGFQISFFLCNKISFQKG